jgi:hypothetical protein
MTKLRSLLGTWWLLLFGLALGAVLGGADVAATGSAGRAAADVAIVAGYTLVLSVLRSRSETASVLAGQPVDERWQAINLHALATAGLVGALVALGGFAVSEAAGHDPSGFAIVAAVMGLSYFGGIFWFRWRL